MTPHLRSSSGHSRVCSCYIQCIASGASSTRNTPTRRTLIKLWIYSRHPTSPHPSTCLQVLAPTPPAGCLEADTCRANHHADCIHSTIDLQYAALNQSKYRDFNADLLNSSAQLVNETLTNGTIHAPNFLFATLVAANATEGPNSSSPGDPAMPATSGSGGGPDGSTKSSLAMIILYAITGCVSALFCVVIVSGVS